MYVMIPDALQYLILFLHGTSLLSDHFLPLNHRHASLALDVYAGGLSTDYVVLEDEDLVLGAHIDHYGAALVMRERAPRDIAVTLD
jgi:predicted nucleic acid-binding protein